MKKKALSLFITLCAVCTLALASFACASAATPTGSPLSGDLGSRTLTSGEYYLSGDATGKLTVEDGATVTFDLNGHTLSAASASDTVITNNGTLTLIDTGMTNGKITGGAKGVVQNGTLTVGGGLNITGNNGTEGENSCNLYLPDGKTINIDNDDHVPTVAMSIGITTQTAPTVGSPVIFTSEALFGNETHFFSDSENSAVWFNNESNVLELRVVVASITDDTGKTTKYETVQAALDVAKSGQTVKLIADCTESVKVDLGYQASGIMLDLNGHVLKAESDGYGITIADITLTLQDSNPESIHTDYDTLRGGIITGGYSGLYIAGGAIVNMYGGTVANHSGNKGGVYIEAGNGTFNMYSGTICKNTNTAQGGGGVYNTGTFNMYGGSITGNTANRNFVNNGRGGGVYNTGTFNMYGGEIFGNTAKKQGNGVYNDGTMIVGGTAKVEGNTTGTGSTAKTSNVYLPSGKTLTVSDTKPLTSGASIGVTLQSGTGKFTSNGAKTDEAFFFSDNALYVDKYNEGDGSGGYLELVDGYAVTCASCTNGTVSVGNQTSAYSGETVTVTATPDEGYELDAVTITKTDSGADVTKEVGYDSACATFTMPDYAVTVSATFKAKPAHIHSWTYAASKSSAELNFDDTITATCGNEGCTAEDTTLIIQAPVALVYDGKAHNANFGEAISFCGGNLPEITYEYKATSDGKYASTTNTIAVGYYKASATVGEGAAAKTISVEYTVSKAQLTLTGTQVLDKPYDGNTTISCGVGTVQGAVEGEAVTVDVESSTVTDKNVGTNKPVTIVFKVTGKDAGNYIAPANNTSLTATIYAVQLYISESEPTTAANKAYDGNTTATANVGTVSGIVWGDDVKVDVDTATFSDKNVGTSKAVSVTYTLSGDDAGNYIKPADGSTTADISAAQLSVTGSTADGKTYDGNTNAVAHIGTLSGKVDGDDVSVSIASATFDNKNAGNGHVVTIVYTMSGTGAGNYLAPANDTTSADISPAQLTVTGSTADGKTYDGNTNAVAHIGTLGGKVDGDDVSVSIASATFDNKNASNGHVVTIVYTMSGTGAGNYIVPVSETTSADIDKKPVSVTAANKASYVGSELVALTYTADELASGDSWVGELATTANKDMVGTYPITQNTLTVSDGNESNNYTITFTEGTYTVKAKETQTLTFAGVPGGTLTKTYGDAAFTETVSGAATTVSYESTDTSVATVDANGTVTILKAGTTTIKATAAETAEYAAGSAEYTLTVSTLKVAVPVAKSDLVYNGQTQTGVVADSSVYTLTNNTATAADSYTAVASLNDKTNYAWDLTNPTSDDQSISWSIAKKQLTINGSAADGKTYDGNTNAVAHIGALSGKVDGDDVNVSIASATFDNKNAGNGHDVTISYAMSGSATANYLVPANDTTSADIDKKPIDVTAADKTSYVGSELVDLTYTADELASGDSWTGKLTTTANKDVVGTYPITQNTLMVSDGNSGNNYTITFTEGTYTVTAKIVQTLTFAGVPGGTLTKTYGDDAFTETVSGAATTVSYESTDTSVATVDANGTVTILKAGTTIIKATASETAEYAQGSAQYTLTVNKIKVAVPVAITGLVYNGQIQTGVELPQGALYTLTNNTATDANTYTAVASLNDKINYAWDGVSPEDADQNIPWSIAQKQVTVTADDKSMVLGNKVPELTATVEGTLGTDKVAYAFESIDPKTQGAYTITVKGDVSQGNYAVAYVQGTLIVSAPQADKAANPEDLAKVLAKYRADEQYKGKSLDVVLKTDAEVSQADKDLIASKAASGKQIVYSSADLILVVTDESGTTEKNIGGENTQLISVTYKFDFAKKTDLQVFRTHDSVVEELTETANAAGEFVKYDKDAGTVTVTASKYSAYAIAYTVVEDKQDSSAIPATGDTTGLLVLAGAAGAAFAAGSLVVARRKREE